MEHVTCEAVLCLLIATMRGVLIGFYTHYDSTHIILHILQESTA